MKLNTIYTALPLAAVCFLLASCRNNMNQEKTDPQTQYRGSANSETNKAESDAKFLSEAAEINMEEMQLGRLAKQAGRSAEVRDLGKMIEDFHSVSQRDLTFLAASKSIPLPFAMTEKAQDDLAKLNQSSGDAFDKSFTDLVVKKHEKAIKIYQTAASECKDDEIRGWAQTSLSGLRLHLNDAIECRRKLDKM